MMVAPSQISIPTDRTFMGTFGNTEAEAVACLLVLMCQEAGQWQPLSWMSIIKKLNAERRQPNPPMIYQLWPDNSYYLLHVGLSRLLREGFLRDNGDEKNPNFEVTEAFIKALQTARWVTS